jgi:hypothetical protein
VTATRFKECGRREDRVVVNIDHALFGFGLARIFDEAARLSRVVTRVDVALGIDPMAAGHLSRQLRIVPIDRVLVHESRIDTGPV